MCNKSDSIAKIAAALVAFSAEVKSITHDAENPHFRSQYTSLDHMIDETKPILAKHGLSVMQFPGGDGDRITVRTMVIHNSGEWIESEPLILKPTKLDPQGAGSAITYARRYSYAAALSLSLGDDDDGNSVSQQPAQRTPQNQSRASTHAPQENSNSVTSQLISQAQINYCHKLKKEKDINDDDFGRMVVEISGKESIKDMTKKEASELINLLNSI
jgi:hypothetical protein